MKTNKKKLLLLLVLVFNYLNGNAQSQCIDYVYIPDTNFKAILVADASININGDTEISCTEASQFRGTIDVESQSITSLIGIQAFPNLRFLKCTDNLLRDLDVSYNVELELLYCSENELTSLDVSNNLELLNLSYDNNTIEHIDLSNNTKLWSLGCDSNNISSLDISNNKNLGLLSCSSNLITDLDLSEHFNLQWFVCNSNNNLTSLNVANGFNENINLFYANGNPNLSCIQVDDVTYSTDNWPSIGINTGFSTDCATFCSGYVNIPDVNFKALLISDPTINTDGDTEICIKEAKAYTGTIYASANGILDLTGVESFVNITALYCDYNSLETLDLSSNTSLTSLSCGSNNLTSLNIANGNNMNMGVFDFITFNNPDLTCIQVDDVNYSTTTWAYIDGTSSFSTDCSTFCADYVNIPDANFKAILVSDSYINTDGDTEICSTEAEAFTGVIYAWVSNISDLTGIESFTNITGLYCDYNSLTVLDVSNNTALTKLSCSGNSLTSLNVSNGNNLNMENFDFIAYNNPALECIQVDSVVYSTANWALKDTSATFNTNCNTGFCIVNIPDANFKTALIDNASINTDGDTEISCDEAEAFTGIINVSNKLISDLTGIESFANITGLYCDYNSITSLDVSGNTELTTLSCSGNSLISLNVANGNNHNMATFNFIAYNNSNLTCIEVDDVAYSTTTWILKDATANYSIDCSSTIVSKEASINNEEILDNNFKTEVNKFAITVYPNPVRNTLNISLKSIDVELKEIIIYSSLGEKVLSSKVKRIDVSSLPKGFYVLEIISEDGERLIKKIIKE